MRIETNGCGSNRSLGLTWRSIRSATTVDCLQSKVNKSYSHYPLFYCGTNLKGFNGKEKIDEINGGGNDVDFGDRMVDVRLGRWLKVDPLAHAYSSISVYAQSINNPINAIDIDGRLVIYVNGEVFSFGGKFNDTGKYNQKRASRDYWGISFTNEMQTAFGEKVYNKKFVDGDLSSSASVRNNRGNLQAKADFQEIIKNLKRDENGKIVETIKVVSHSKGVATANGYIDGLKEMIEQNKEQFADPSNVIETHIALAPHQSWAIDIKPSNTATVGITHWGDILSDDDLGGDAVTIETQGPSFGRFFQGGHLLSSFAEEASLMAKILTKNKSENQPKYQGTEGALPNQKDYNSPCQD